MSALRRIQRRLNQVREYEVVGVVEWTTCAKKYCRKTEAIRAHRCSKCRMQGHLEKFRRNNADGGQRQGQPKKSFQASQSKDRGKRNSKGNVKGEKASSNKAVG